MATSVRQLEEESRKQNATRVKIFNPSSDDFTVKFLGKPHTIHSKEVKEFPFSIAMHVKKHLANHILNERGAKDKNVEETLRNINEEIEVKL